MLVIPSTHLPEPAQCPRPPFPLSKVAMPIVPTVQADGECCHVGCGAEGPLGMLLSPASGPFPVLGVPPIPAAVRSPAPLIPARGYRHMLPPHRVSRKTGPRLSNPRHLPGCKPCEPCQRALGTENTLPALVLAAEGCGVQRTEENQELGGGSGQCLGLGLQAHRSQRGPDCDRSRPGSCLCRLPAMMFPVNNAFPRQHMALAEFGI